MVLILGPELESSFEWRCDYHESDLFRISTHSIRVSIYFPWTFPLSLGSYQIESILDRSACK